MATTVPCHCESPQTDSIYGRLAGDNGYECDDGTKGHCSINQACFSNNFAKGKWSDGCKTVYTRTQPSHAPPARKTTSRLARRHSESLSASVQPRACACVFVHCVRCLQPLHLGPRPQCVSRLPHAALHTGACLTAKWMLASPDPVCVSSDTTPCPLFAAFLGSPWCMADGRSK